MNPAGVADVWRAVVVVDPSLSLADMEAVYVAAMGGASDGNEEQVCIVCACVCVCVRV